MYNDPSAKDLLAQYPRQLAEGGNVAASPTQSWQAPAVQQRKTSLTPIYAPNQVPAGYTGKYIDPTTLSASQQNARTRAEQDRVLRAAINQTGLDTFGGRDYRRLQQDVRRGDINAQNIKQQFVDPVFEKRVKSAYESIGRTGAVMPALQTTSKGALDEASYKNVTQAEYDYWTNLLKQGKISGKDFQKAFLSEAANEIPGTNLEAQRVYIDNARKALGLPELVSKPAATPYDPLKNFGVTTTPTAVNIANLNNPVSNTPATVQPVNLSTPTSTGGLLNTSQSPNTTTAAVQPVNLSTTPTTAPNPTTAAVQPVNLSTTPTGTAAMYGNNAVTTPTMNSATRNPQTGLPIGNTGGGLGLADMINPNTRTYSRPTSGFGMAFLNQGGAVEKKSGESEQGSDAPAMDLEQILLENSRAQLGPLDVQEVRSSRGPGKYDTRVSKNVGGLEAYADVDVNDKKLSQLGARLVGQGRIGNYEVQYMYDPETKQPVITGAVRKELSPTSDVSAEGVYVPQKDGKDYYNAGVRYTKRFENGGSVNKKQVGHPNKYADQVARYGRKGQEDIADMVGLGEEVKFANAIPEFYFPKDEQLNGRGDAMRHLLLQAQITKKLGRTPAEIASFIHENMLSGGQSDAEQAMDEYNDALGMDIGLRSKDKADMAYQALQAIKSGQAKTITKPKKAKKFEDGGEVRTLRSIDVTPEDRPPVTAADIERMMRGSYLAPNGVAPELEEVKPKYPALNAWSKGLELAAAPFDKYALDKRIPLVGGMTAADFMGMNDAASLARDVSYGDPVVRGGSLQTSKIDPRLLAAADIVPVAGAAAKGATTLAKAGAKEVARQIETGTGVIGRNTMDPRMYAKDLTTPEGIIADGIERLTAGYKKHGGIERYQYSGRSWAAIDKIESGIQDRLEKAGLSNKDAFATVFGPIKSAAQKALDAFEKERMAKWEAADAQRAEQALVPDTAPTKETQPSEFKMSDLPSEDKSREVYKIPSGTLLYHGAHGDSAKKIVEGGSQLKSNLPYRSSGGTTDEGGLIWLGDKETASYFAESNADPMAVFEEQRRTGQKRKPGQVFALTTDKPLKLVSRNYVMTQKEAEALNEALGLPEYKHLQKGYTLEIASSRAHNYRASNIDRYKMEHVGEISSPWPVILRTLKADGFYDGSGIALSADALPVTPVKKKHGGEITKFIKSKK